MNNTNTTASKRDDAAEIALESFDAASLSPTTATRPRSRSSIRSCGQTSHRSPDDIETLDIETLDIEALDKSTVAELSPTQISQMTSGELVRVILAAKLPLLRPETERRLEFQNLATLQRLANLAHRCCRNQGY